MKTFDLFRQFGPLKASWLSDYEKLEDAITAMRKIAAIEPGSYFIYDEDVATAVSRLDSSKGLTTESKTAFLYPQIP